MKSLKNRHFALLTIFGVLAVQTANANIVTPASLILTGYQMWASTSADCTSLIKVMDNGTAGKVVDIAKSTDFGAATLPPDGTYRCLAVVVNDTYTIIPAVTGTSSGTNELCVAGTTYTQDTCHTGTSATLPDGTVTTCGTGQVDKIVSYISTTGTAGADGGTPSTAKKLNAEIVVAGGSVDVTLFVANPDGLVDVSGSCGQNSNAVLGVR